MVFQRNKGKSGLILLTVLFSILHSQVGYSDPSSQSLCDMPQMRGTAIYNKYCGSENTGNSNYDYGAAQRAQAAAAAAAQRAEEQRRRDAELEQQRIEADNKRRMEEIENQAKFNRDKAEAISTLKGSLGTSITSNGSGSSELKGTLTDTGIKNLQPDQKSRDLEGPHAAWKQLHCAASIASDALAALQTSLNDPQHDMDEFKYLSGEASNALNGQHLGVECPPAPAYPSNKRKTVDMDRGKAVTQKILDRAAAVADRIRKTAPPSNSSNTATLKQTASSGDDDLAKLRAQQLALNRNQERKYDPTSQANINLEHKNKKEVASLILAAKKVQMGDFSFSLNGAKP